MRRVVMVATVAVIAVVAIIVAVLLAMFVAILTAIVTIMAAIALTGLRTKRSYADNQADSEGTELFHGASPYVACWHAG
jgi:MFS superfamily sulfate permease-like transporter